MNIEQLRYFREICRQGSITKAAGTLYLSPQALSKSVHVLETDLGARLLERSNRGIVPTTAGKILAERSGTLLTEYDSMIRDIRKHTDELQKELILGIVSCGLMDFPIEQYKPFMARYPQHSLVIREAGDEEMETALMAGELSVALLGGPVSHPQLDTVLLTSFRYSLMVREDSPLSGRKEISMSELDGMPLLLLAGRYKARTVIDRELKRHNVRPASVINVQQRDMLYRLCLQGAGSSILLTDDKNTQVKEGVRFLPIHDFSQTWDLYAARKRGLHTEAEKALFDFICNWPF